MQMIASCNVDDDDDDYDDDDDNDDDATWLGLMIMVETQLNI